MSRSHNNVFLSLIGINKRNTDKAILLVLTDTEALVEEDAKLEVWLPKSQIKSITPMKDAEGNVCVMASEWIVGQKDLRKFVRSVATPATTAAKASHPIPTTPPVRSHYEPEEEDVPY